jgi:predicted PurR-regulated permease PerM
MDDKDFKKIMTPLMIVGLALLSFYVVRPLFVSITVGLLFAYVFYPVYIKLNNKIKSENLSAGIIVSTTSIAFLAPIIFLIPSFVKQLLSFYEAIRNADFAPIILKLLPSLASSKQATTEIIAAASHLNAKISGFIISLSQSLILGSVEIVFGIIIVIFTFYFALKEVDNLKEYLGSILPISKEHKKKFYEKMGQVTDSVLYSHIVVGILQGIIAGIGYFMFGLPNPLLLTVLTMVAGVLPVIGPWFVWVPIDIFLFLNGDNTRGMQLLLFGLFVINWVDTLLRPMIMSKRADMNSAIALIGSVGGIYAFGFIGFVLGPLILAMFILLIEIYKDNAKESIVLQEVKEELINETK